MDDNFTGNKVGGSEEEMNRLVFLANLLPDRRERISTAMLVGILTHDPEKLLRPPSQEPSIVEIAVAWADAIIEELDKEEE